MPARPMDWIAALGPERITRELLASGLRDRDLENRPSGARLEEFRTVTGAGKRVVVDCADTEPGCGIRKFVVASKPALVVAGAFAAAVAVGAERLEFRLSEDDEVGYGTLTVATGDQTHAQVEVEIELVQTPFKQDLKGYEPVPTLVIDVETAVGIATVVEEGAEAFRKTGSAGSPGLKTFQLVGPVAHPLIVELPLGTSLRALIEEHGGGMTEGSDLTAVIVGGSKGVCYTPDELDSQLDFDSLHEAGGAIGSGLVALLDQGACIVDEVKKRLERSCHDECGKCLLGREGSFQLHEIVTDMTRGKSKSSDLDMIREIARAMRLGGACASGRMTPNLLLSTLEKFPGEYEAHMKRRLCKALVCEKYVTYHILPDLCDGCGACADECPEEAIDGGRRKIHVIDQDMCERCGRCYEVCADLRQAVVKAGAIKPRTPKKPIPVGSWNS